MLQSVLLTLNLPCISAHVGFCNLQKRMFLKKEYSKRYERAKGCCFSFRPFEVLNILPLYLVIKIQTLKLSIFQGMNAQSLSYKPLIFFSCIKLDFLRLES